MLSIPDKLIILLFLLLTFLQHCQQYFGFFSLNRFYTLYNNVYTCMMSQNTLSSNKTFTGFPKIFIKRGPIVYTGLPRIRIQREPLHGFLEYLFKAELYMVFQNTYSKRIFTGSSRILIQRGHIHGFLEDLFKEDLYMVFQNAYSKRTYTCFSRILIQIGPLYGFLEYLFKENLYRVFQNTYSKRIST